MCGIAGIVRLDGGPVDRQALGRMQAALIHRGPDSGGTMVDGSVGLTMRRLKVIDLEGGDQPIATPDGLLEIVLNGEIYNYRELRKELRLRGHVLRTDSDTEVLLHMYREHGSAMFAHLNGMFAFAIWDREHREVVVARDAMGIKPLLYARLGQTVLFASEAGALLASGLLPCELDLELAPALTLLQYVPEPRTMYRHVLRLPPGHLLRIGRTGLAVERIEPGQGSALEPDGGGLAGAGAAGLLEGLRLAVRARIVADVPVGAFLSGGIDSSLVTALMVEQAPARVRTFSVGIDDGGSFNELEHARLAARELGTDHHELIFSSDDLAALLPEVIAGLDDPIIDPALLPTYSLARLAREHVTVVLSGEGADELLGGYRRYRLQHVLGRWPRWIWRLLPSMGRHRVRQAMDALGQREPLESHIGWCTTMAGEVAEGLLAPELVQASWSYVRERFAALAAAEPPDLPPAELAMRLDQRTWLVDDLLVKVDRMSMRHGLEARVPFLDRRVVDLARATPVKAKIRAGVGKAILREAARGLVPEAIIRRPKHGFDLPLGRWFRTGLKSFALDHLSRLEREPAIDRAALRRVVERHMSGRDDLGLLIFSLVVLASLLERGRP